MFRVTLSKLRKSHDVIMFSMELCLTYPPVYWIFLDLVSRRAHGVPGAGYSLIWSAEKLARTSILAVNICCVPTCDPQNPGEDTVRLSLPLEQNPRFSTPTAPPRASVCKRASGLCLESFVTTEHSNRNAPGTKSRMVKSGRRH